VKEIHGCASGLERETLIGSVTSRLAQPVGEAIAANSRKRGEILESIEQREARDVESGWTELPIDPPCSLNLPQVTG
jgi:hypothetical protein